MSEYLSDEEQLARLKGWWSENGVRLLVLVSLALAAVFGWRWYQTERANKIAAGSAIYAQFQKADPDIKQALASELAKAAKGTAYPVLAQLALAQSALAANGATAAKPMLEAALAQADDPDLMDLIRLRLARVAQQEGDAEGALALLAQVRGSGFRSLVAELKGDIHMARNEQVLAHEAYLAALAAVEPGDRRPVLALKANTTAAPVATVSTSAALPAATESETAAQGKPAQSTSDGVDADNG